MDGVEERVRRAVLQAYAADGRSPVPAQIAAASGLPSGEVGSALQRLAGRDLVVLDGAGRVTGAYLPEAVAAADDGQPWPSWRFGY